MESNHRFLFVRQVSSPLDHGTLLSGLTGIRTRIFDVRSPGAPGLDDEPICCERKPRDSNPQVACATACFQDRFLIQPDDFRYKLRELESNQSRRAGSSEPGIAYQQRRSRNNHVNS